MARADRPSARRARRTRALPLATGPVVAVLTVSFLAGGVSALSLVHERAAAAATADARANQARADRAATTRLTAQAAHYAVAQDAAARDAAVAALDEAEAVLASAPQYVGEATVEPLDDAVTELAALVDDLVPPAVDDTGVVRTSASEAAPTTRAPSTDPEPVPGDGATGDAADDDASWPVRGDDDVLDLEESDALLAAAEHVAALTTQVEALRDAVAGELAAAQEAADARRAEEAARREAQRQAAWVAAQQAPNGRIPSDLLCRPAFADVLVLCEAVQSLEALNEAYRAATGADLGVVSGYRSLSQQYDVRATRGGLAARPGTSNHGRGVAVDFADFGAVGQFDDPDYLWMVENGPAFGWVHPPSMGPGGSGPLEPWHWEYAGH